MHKSGTAYKPSKKKKWVAAVRLDTNTASHTPTRSPIDRNDKSSSTQPSQKERACRW